MTLKQFFQNLGQGIAQGWANLRDRFSPANHEEANPLFEMPVDVSDESYEKQQPSSSTATMTTVLMIGADEQPGDQPVSDLDALEQPEGIYEYKPTISERVGRGASHAWNSFTSLFKRDEGRSTMCDWLDGDRVSSYSGLDENIVDDPTPRPGAI